ncbi:unnamed protein product [Pedinophyceae sp. YPF-701]|nr:unnamed protein product [Pedinophyceae sp. YPF-701]
MKPALLTTFPPERARWVAEERARLEAGQIGGIPDVEEAAEEDVADDAGLARRSARRPRDFMFRRDFQDLIHKIETNSREFQADGKILRLKQYIPSEVRSAEINRILDALWLNDRIEVLYIQNFELAMFDEQLDKIVELCQSKWNIYAVNIGENAEISMKAWDKFTQALPLTNIAYMYMSEHLVVKMPWLKDKMRENMRENRKRCHILDRDPQVVRLTGNMWWNPRAELKRYHERKHLAIEERQRQSMLSQLRAEEVKIRARKAQLTRQRAPASKSAKKEELHCPPPELVVAMSSRTGRVVKRPLSDAERGLGVTSGVFNSMSKAGHVYNANRVAENSEFLDQQLLNIAKLVRQLELERQQARERFIQSQKTYVQGEAEEDMLDDLPARLRQQNCHRGSPADKPGAGMQMCAASPRSIEGGEDDRDAPAAATEQPGPTVSGVGSDIFAGISGFRIPGALTSNAIGGNKRNLYTVDNVVGSMLAPNKPKKPVAPKTDLKDSTGALSEEEQAFLRWAWQVVNPGYTGSQNPVARNEKPEREVFIEVVAEPLRWWMQDGTPHKHDTWETDDDIARHFQRVGTLTEKANRFRLHKHVVTKCLGLTDEQLRNFNPFLLTSDEMSALFIGTINMWRTDFRLAAHFRVPADALHRATLKSHAFPLPRFLREQIIDGCCIRTGNTKLDSSLSRREKNKYRLARVHVSLDVGRHDRVALKMRVGPREEGAPVPQKRQRGYVEEVPDSSSGSEESDDGIIEGTRERKSNRRLLAYDDPKAYATGAATT